MRPRLQIIAACLLAALGSSACGDGETGAPAAKPYKDTGRYAGTTLKRGGLKLPARIQGHELALAYRGRFAGRFWPGVNLGVTVPGRHPGELAPTRRDYDRWLDGMQDLGARVVRVYTILRPDFHEALAAHNERNPRTPLYFIQGVWIPEEELLASHDTDAISAEFDREIADAVAAVHGDATLPERPGHASGRYRTDVARWLLAWSPGVEWDPYATRNNDRRQPGAPAYQGRYIASTEGATRTESWLAARLDQLATLEAQRGWSRPLTFTNWLTTDPLDHPEEPMDKEDMVSVDAMHLRAHHKGQAVMITEFGVPTGIDSAHLGPLGRDQGDHPEQEAGRMDADMLGAIERQKMAGGLLFSYTDEWFKRTWNTMDMEKPEDRRPLWQNALTNEEQFGLVAAEAGKQAAVTADGSDHEWTRTQSQQIYEGGGTVREVRATHDANWLYLLVRRSGEKAVQLGFDVRPGGNQDLTGWRAPTCRWRRPTWSPAAAPGCARS